MTAVVEPLALLPHLAPDEPLVAVPAAHLRRLLAIESAVVEALTYQRASGAISPSQARRLRTATEESR